MRILLTSQHRFPASVGGESGQRVSDCLALGLAKLGHDVVYALSGGSAVTLPAGIGLVSSPIWDVDIVHTPDLVVSTEAQTRGLPWVRTCHVDYRVWSWDLRAAGDNWIFVSRTLARTYGSDRYVLNGIDPAEYIYSESKEDYMLFVPGELERGAAKGLDIALSLCRKSGTKLVIAGYSRNTGMVAEFNELCRREGATFVGEVYGTQKAQLLAGARAMLFPTQLNESFGIVMVEALMSGTPVICSDHGACPELITPDVGFVCKDEQDYLAAIEQVSMIAPQACRAKAMRDFHYERMAADYVTEYEREIERLNSG